MRVRVGGSRHIRTRKLAADNRRLTKPATERLADVIDRVNDRHRNALEVDGIEILLWRRQTAGAFCSCHGNSQTRSSVTSPGQSQVNITGEVSEQIAVGDDGLARKESELFINDSGDEVRVVSLRDDRRYNNQQATPSLKEDMDFTDDPEEEYFKDSAKRTFRNDQGEFEYEELDEDFDDDIPGDFSIEMEDFEDVVGSDDSISRLNRSIEALLTGGETTPCGICFSTGWTEGYQLTNGRRIVLVPGTLAINNGFAIDRDAAPNRMTARASDNPVARWKIDLPRFISNVPRLAVWNNLEQVSGAKLYAKFKGGSEFVLLNPSLLKSRNGMDNQATEIEVRIELRPEFSNDSQIFITHVELVIEYGPRIIGQIPQIENSETFEFYEADVQSNLEWPASVAGISLGSIAIDSKHRIAWRVIGVTRNETADKKLFSIETAVQKIQKSDPLDRLNLYRERLVTLKNFKGLEREQGSAQPGRNEKK